MKTVLIITASFDPQTDLLIAELRRRDVPCVRWNTYEFPLSSVLTYQASNGAFSAQIISDGRSVDLASIGSVWWQWDRPAGFLAELTTAERLFAEREAELALNVLPTIGNFLWINHPIWERQANSKAAQLFAARTVGLEIPRTVITNNPDEVRRFVATSRRPIVYKASSPARNMAPDEIATKINAFMKSLELIYGAFDFIVTPDGRYVFLEVNPGGAYMWVEAATGLAITPAIADALSAPCRP
jgi:hypothetical protein